MSSYFFFVFVSSAEVRIPSQPDLHVVDLAGIIDNPTELTLNRYLLELEHYTTCQMVILTLDSLHGELLEELSLRIANDTWKLGQKEKDNGILLLIAFRERKYRFEIGYGLEELLPDSYVGSVARDLLVPYFREGDYSKGIALAAIAVINIIADDAGVQITGMPESQYREPEKDNVLDLVLGIAAIPFFLFIFYVFIKHSFMPSPKRRWAGRGTWYYGSGSTGYAVGGFGGGGGGFGGGRGGGFGGGGVSGGW